MNSNNIGLWCSGNTADFKSARRGFESCQACKFNKNMIMTELEERIIELREEGDTYHVIQLKLGNPSKKFIKTTIRKYSPDLAGDVVANHGRYKSK